MRRVNRSGQVLLFALTLISPGIAAGSPNQAPQIIVSAAASLTDVLTELQPQAEAFTGARVLYNFGGSGTLRRQIEQGAPADVIFSAAAEDMDVLEREGLILPDTRRNLLSNSMVLIGGAGAAPARGVEDLRKLLSSADFLAIGNPDSVPAGRYAVQALTAYNLFSLVEKKLVLGNTVREVLQYVQSGSAPLGIVFLTDARSVESAGDVRELFIFPDTALKTPVLYPVAVVRATANPAAARRMIDFLQTDAARSAFEQAGFILK